MYFVHTQMSCSFLVRTLNITFYQVQFSTTIPSQLAANRYTYIKEWDQKGVKNINDLVHENGDFFTQDEFEHTFNIKTNCVQYIGFKRAIVAYARTHNVISFSKKNYIRHYCLQRYPFLIKSKKGGNDFYTILNQNLDKPTSQHKWNNVYNIEEETWKAIYSPPFKLSLGTKMQ